MNQDETTDDELQKAIDGIAKPAIVDPVFSDPIAAPSSVPEGDTGGLDESVGPFPEPEIIENPQPESEGVAMPPEMLNTPIISKPNTPDMLASDFDSPIMPLEEKTVGTEVGTMKPVMDIQQIKMAALKDLAPILETMNINPSQKFKIYREMFENLHDNAVLEPAYKTAKAMTDKNERGEALLFLVESIN